MISVSDAWKENQLDLIVTEGFVEITFAGTGMVFNKTHITKYTHEQNGCLLSGSLPTNKISFSLDNSLATYNPNTVNFVEHQKITVKYGFDYDGDGVADEWINAGTFYLTEWNTPSNGLESSFEARDMLAFFMDKPYRGVTSGTLKEIAESAISQAGLPSDAVVEIDNTLSEYTTTITTAYSLAEVLQLCANAACCVMWQDRDGVLRIKPVHNLMSDYVVREGWAYSYPEYDVSKPLKAVNVTYANNESRVLTVANGGETQSVSNELITQETQAYELAHWVAALLKNRKKISGEFRADPRLDIFDKVKVESKYGVNEAVVITSIKYSFTGSFRGAYEGRVGSFDAITNAYYSSDLYCGEV